MNKKITDLPVRMTKVFILCLLSAAVIGGYFSCAYYNTFYNAQDYFNTAKKDLEKQTDQKITVAIKRKFASAIEKSNKVIIEFPDSKWTDDALYIIALSHYYREEYSISKKKMEEFIVQYPGSELLPDMELWYGKILWKMGEPEQAIHQLGGIIPEIEDKSMLSKIYYTLAEIYEKTYELDSALYYYDQVTEIGREYDLCAQSSFNSAEVYLEQGKIDEAIKYLKRVSRYSPSRILRDETQVLFARIYRESERYDEARELIMGKLADEDNKTIWGALEIQLGLIYLAESDFESSRSRFSQITETYKKSAEAAEAYYHLAMINMTHFHDYKIAEEQFNSVTKEFNKSQFALESKQKAAEIKRFFSVKKEYDDLFGKISLITAKESETETDSANLESDENMDVEELKEKIETEIELQSQIIDTASVYATYYKSLYEIAELYYFNFLELDSAVTKFAVVSDNMEYNPYVDKALYALYYIYYNENDREKSEYYRGLLVSRFPDSQYSAYTENREPVVPQNEQEAEAHYLEAEDFFESNVDSALARLDSLVQYYPDTFYGEKSSYAIAWLLKNRLYDLDRSIAAYRDFIEFYPKSPLAEGARTEYNDLSSLLSTISADTTAADTTDANTE